MTVKSLNEQDKEAIGFMFKNQNASIKAIALTYNVSPRTISRILDELEIARPQALARGQAYHAMKTLEAHNMSVSGLQNLLKHLTDHQVLVKGEQDENILVIPDKLNNNSVRQYMMHLEDTEYNALLADVIHLREAKKQNVHVQTAMLRLQEKVNKNEHDNKEGKLG